MQTENNNKKIGISIGVIVAAIVLYATFFSSKSTPVTPVVTPLPTTDQTPTQNQPASSDTPTPVTVPPVDTKKPVASVYKNGTYSATGSYMSPGGEDQIGVSLTLSNDVITAVSATNMAGDHTSSRYQDRFIAGYKTYVVGKKISDVYLTRVSGSSLTPAGFNDALNQIKAQAQA